MRLPSCTNMTFTPTCDDEKQAAARFFYLYFFRFFFFYFYWMTSAETTAFRTPDGTRISPLTSNNSERAHAHLSERDRSMHARRTQNSTPSHLQTRAHARERKKRGLAHMRKLEFRYGPVDFEPDGGQSRFPTLSGRPGFARQGEIRTHNHQGGEQVAESTSDQRRPGKKTKQ